MLFHIEIEMILFKGNDYVTIDVASCIFFSSICSERVQTYLVAQM